MLQYVLSTVSKLGGMSPRVEEVPAFPLADITYTIGLFMK